MVREIHGDPRGDGLKVAIVASRFNELVTTRLVDGALAELRGLGVADADVTLAWVPGAIELPLVAREFARSGRCDAVVCVGAVIKGETDHYRHVSEAAASGTLRAAMDTGVPVAFGVLTVEALEQAMRRAGVPSGGKSDNKGAEAARAAVETALVLRAIRAPRAAEGAGS